LSALHRTHPHPCQLVQKAQHYPSPNRPSAILASVAREPVLRPCMRGPYTREHYATAPYPSTNHCLHRSAQARRRGTQVKLARAPSSKLKLSLPTIIHKTRKAHPQSDKTAAADDNKPATRHPRTLTTNLLISLLKVRNLDMSPYRTHSLTHPSIHPSTPFPFHLCLTSP
jgi:hypothetical protein